MHIEKLEPGEVFVFGSNGSGAHGGGAARFALDHFGAAWGQSEGLQGQSYGIDTMSGPAVFEEHARRFVAFAVEHPELRFLVTEVGCGIAGYRPEQVAGFFAGAGENVALPESFRAVLKRD
ncbi:A1S_2505 family phage non-structural protein [Microbacterium sp. SLBN-111]|uniref:A1S_2505 family phage non-structural protein n=1 Tax=Microbacterium sp. SLBN-111 TaxID=3377733 RepID=UPI003C765041